MEDLEIPSSIEDFPKLPESLHKKIKERHDNDNKFNLLYCSRDDPSETLHEHIRLLKKGYYPEILDSEEIITERYSAEKILIDLFNEFIKSFENMKDMKDLKNSYLFNMLPGHVRKRIKEELGENENRGFGDNKFLARSICDYIAGMTDRYAISFWEKLNTPCFLKRVG